MDLFLRSISIIWLSVPLVKILKSNLIKSLANCLEFNKTCFIYCLYSGVLTYFNWEAEAEGKKGRINKWVVLKYIKRLNKKILKEKSGGKSTKSKKSTK